MAIYVLVCAFSFELITTIAKMTYDEGTSPETVANQTHIFVTECLNASNGMLVHMR